MNPEYIINVYSCNSDGSNIQPRRISKIRDKTKKLVNLLMLTQDGKYHYVLINDLNKLLGKTAVMTLQKTRGIISKSWRDIWMSLSNIKDVG